MRDDADYVAEQIDQFQDELMDAIELSMKERRPLEAAESMWLYYSGYDSWSNERRQ